MTNNNNNNTITINNTTLSRRVINSLPRKMFFVPCAFFVVCLLSRFFCFRLYFCCFVLFILSCLSLALSLPGDDRCSLLAGYFSEPFFFFSASKLCFFLLSPTVFPVWFGLLLLTTTTACTCTKHGRFKENLNVSKPSTWPYTMEQRKYNIYISLLTLV